ncbi:MAG: glycosyltransferase family 2 protein [Myxococcota bacterium]
MKPCLLIPIYDHGETIGGVVESLAYLDLPCLVVDDGSGASTRAELDRLEREHAFVRVHHRAQNGGRGAALRTGYRWAHEQGFSHAVQLDADDQHDPRDVPRLLEAAQKDESALVLGRPLFDESAPALRMFGRKFSQGLVWLETLSMAIEDPLCVFRCFPLAPTVALLDRHPLGDRMDFDPEIAVRLYWEGLPIASVPTRVRYHEGGLSHFAPAYDSWLIARAHGRLVAGMLPRAVGLLRRGRA